MRTPVQLIPPSLAGLLSITSALESFFPTARVTASIRLLISISNSREILFAHHGQKETIASAILVRLEKVAIFRKPQLSTENHVL